ncbi:hypothetical protein M431DRAFT_442379 [Trichoderma harzianum CBS 226.95]|uniref:Uncharacterized protein n=1 Tax=Trichoderma harzianum CBS 226.95 TaxID=983964 RepID=A0A2T4A9A3_TRIHA|nr:hypothetical protein M431DRAFT_442379 [Trichoderma harzianum CBS 226.95]PTB53669.1 hypothetical protein M431DRAFT_442379 [Trichoderma harzianum CBS 226.95]
MSPRPSLVTLRISVPQRPSVFFFFFSPPPLCDLVRTAELGEFMHRIRVVTGLDRQRCRDFGLSDVQFRRKGPFHLVLKSLGFSLPMLNY